ncbi:hypothetical protein K7X08_026748 [Anisodus acutangulus]|uniref:Uncharacterized protein n=1 Tax=Anisodus acutangulus TaxID=402998 RepID=A0A9Q1LCD5_9SOLA|nr:hypothetical protein K7X08_026748 [Anisodus acutangulus]
MNPLPVYIIATHRFVSLRPIHFKHNFPLSNMALQLLDTLKDSITAYTECSMDLGDLMHCLLEKMLVELLPRCHLRKKTSQGISLALIDWEYKFMSKYVKVGSVKQAVPVNYGEANVEFVEATDGEAKPAEGGASGSAKPLEDDGPSKISEAAKVAPSESVADYLFGTEGVAAEKRNARNGQFWSFKVLLKFNLPSKIASKISKLALFAATLPRKLIHLRLDIMS